MPDNLFYYTIYASKNQLLTFDLSTNDMAYFYRTVLKESFDNLTIYT